MHHYLKSGHFGKNVHAGNHNPSHSDVKCSLRQEPLMCSYSSANKIFAVPRRNRSHPLSRAMGYIGELRAGSRSAGYERFGSGNLAPLAVLVPIPKPATHSKGASNQHSHCTVYIWMYHVGSHWIALKICTGNKWILKHHFHNFFAMWLNWCTETTY